MADIIDLDINIDQVDRIHHISDVHIRNHSRHEEYNFVLENLYDSIRKRANDNSLIVLTGDIAHSKTEMSPELIDIMSDFFRSLSDIRPTILIPGNHDCFTGDHEVLTEKNGWVEISEYVENRMSNPVATFNTDNAEVFFDVPKNYIQKSYSGKLVHLEGKEIDMKVTPTHRVIHQYGNMSRDKYYTKNGDDIKEGYLIPINGKVSSDILDDRNEFACLLGFSFAEGTFVLKNSDTGACRVQFKLKSEREIEYLNEILDDQGYDINFNLNESEGYKTGSVYSDLAKKVYEYFDGKKEVPWKLLSENNIFIRSFIEGYLKGDGTSPKDDFWGFVSINKKSVEVLTTAARLVGMRSHTSFDREVYGNYENSKRQWIGTLSYNNKVNRTTVSSKNYEDFEGKVYCLDVPNNHLLVRRNDKIWITGNCNVKNSNRLDALTPIVDNLNLDNFSYIKDSGLFKIGNIVFSHFSVFSKVSDYIPAYEIPDEYLKVALYHGIVDRSKTNHDYILTGDLKTSDFIGFDAVLLGDLHAKQRLSKFQIEKMVIDDEDLDKYIDSPHWHVEERSN